MLDLPTIRQTDMPEELRVLFKRYPRDSWEAHPGFKDKTRHWLGAHQTFRRLAGQLRIDAESLLDRDLEAQVYADRLNRFGGNLVGSLMGHHAWEDHSYFPELSAADRRFDAGLALLEQDHHDLDQVLEAFTRQANRVMYLATADEDQMRDEVAPLHAMGETIEAFLARHLSDEEELAVPIILHHRLRG